MESEPNPTPIQVALDTPGLPKVYANGFSIGLTNADAYIVLQEFGKPIAVLNLSYTLAKTLSLRLGQVVADWETKTGQQLVTTDKIDKAFAAADQPDGDKR